MFSHPRTARFQLVERLDDLLRGSPSAAARHGIAYGVTAQPTRCGLTAKFHPLWRQREALPVIASPRRPARYGVTAKFRRIAAVSSGSPSVFTRSVAASGVMRPQDRRT